MKKYQIQVATLLVVVTTLFTGCDKAEKVIEYPAGGLVQFVAKAATGYPDTRIGYSEEGNKMNYTWGELNSERFSVFVPNSNIKHDFSLKGGAHSRNGRFEGQIPEGATTTFATYPGLNGNPATLTAITHDLSNQGLYTSTDALLGNRYHLMWSSTDAAGGELNYQFAHRVSMLKLELTFIGVRSKIKRVSILGGHYKANLNTTNGELSYVDTGKGVIMASDATGFDLVNNALTAYVYLFPEDLTSSTLTITAVDETGKAYTSGDFNGRALTAGTVYRLRKNMSESDYIVAGNSKWAIGNLIADGANGAKIGAPGDGGLYFQYGSLVGWSGSGNDDGTGRGHDNPLSVQVKPVACNVTDWDFTWIGDPTSDDPVNGRGDPCRYYLGTPWRLPTGVESTVLFGLYPPLDDPDISWGSVTDALGWSMVGDFSSGSLNSYVSHISGLQFPISGNRNAYDGGLVSHGSVGYYWLSEKVPSFDVAYNFFFNDFVIRVGPSEGYASEMPYGYSVRCVRD